ncbi:hypothetical protein [Streptomyces sp. NPDC012888]|uniref:hypothetical protein n=1 Tax=Streptomyces sp. NPDC012888 TaxID=3364855 RepID=UPI003697C321
MTRTRPTRQARRTGRVRRTGGVLLCALALAGCGIEPTGVIESGAPASVAVGDVNGTAFIYLVDAEGRLAPVQRQGYPPLSAQALLQELLRGPLEDESAAGLRSELPVTPRGAVGPPSTVSATDAELVVRVRVGFPVLRLGDLARRQLACTVGRAGPSPIAMDGDISAVVVTGPDGSLPQQLCGAGGEGPGAGG